MRRVLHCILACLLAGTVAPLALAQPTPPIPRFIEETDTAGLQSRFEGEGEFMVGGGVAVFDCDADGLPEVYVTAGVNKARFYRNRSARGGALKLLEERSGLEITNAIGAYPLDIDGDGNADLVVLRVGQVQVFRGLGGCRLMITDSVPRSWPNSSSNSWRGSTLKFSASRSRIAGCSAISSRK